MESEAVSYVDTWKYLDRAVSSTFETIYRCMQLLTRLEFKCLRE